MNYYLDFEATQFKNKIISIGCVNELGDRFYSLVKPENDKVTKFITDLTGITNEDLATVPGVEEAFSELQSFIQRSNAEEETFFFVYGNGDKDFVKNSLKDIQDKSVYLFAQRLALSFINYANIVKEFFDINSEPSLKKLASFLSKTNIEQTHNALDDAQMLQHVAMTIDSLDGPVENPWPELKRKPAIIIGDANTQVFIQIKHDGALCKFSSYADATDFVMEHFMTPNERAVVKRENVNKRIRKAVSSGKEYYGRKWRKVNG